MTNLFFLIFISLISIIYCSYNPIPIGSVIISTTRAISVLQPKEYNGTDKPTIIFTAAKKMTIIHSVFDPKLRELYILFTNTTDNTVYIAQLLSVEKLHQIIYQLPITFDSSNINKLTSFTSDVNNKRIFLTDQQGNITIISMSGVMKTVISKPKTIENPIRSVRFNEKLNRLFIITDSTVSSCLNLDKNNLQCCQALPKTDQLRSIAFEPSTSRLYAYVIDQQTGLYQVTLNSIGCPIALRPVNTIGSYHNIHLDIYQDLYFTSGSADDSNHNSILMIGNGTQTPRAILFDASIVALHISYPNIKSTIHNAPNCFFGLTYHHYRIAVILAAIFGTIMGIFMCFNALFCIDFFMTKRIIKDLKGQIPHNLLEDRWIKLVEEKYAKLALERNRKKDDPLPKRKSSAGVRKIAPNDNIPTASVSESIQTSNPIPKISAYIRRKSESYVNRRRSAADQRAFPQIPIQEIKEKNGEELL